MSDVIERDKYAEVVNRDADPEKINKWQIIVFRRDGYSFSSGHPFFDSKKEAEDRIAFAEGHIFNSRAIEWPDGRTTPVNDYRCSIPFPAEAK